MVIGTDPAAERRKRYGALRRRFRNAMQRNVAVGGALTAFGVAGYLAGIYAAYPGRAFSLTAVMLGLVLLGVGGLFSGEVST